MANIRPIIIPDLPQKEPIQSNRAVNRANKTTVFSWFFIMIIKKRNVFWIFKVVGFIANDINNGRKTNFE